jgi:orotidine-5'-phosphate decarboxylase
MKNTLSNQAKDKLIFALDAKSYEEALSWIDLLSGHVGMFKVGKELFTSLGPRIVEEIKQKGQKVFLDLKFHDIPNTVARAGEAAVNLNADMFNVHAAGGFRMIQDTVTAVRTYAENKGKRVPIILAVTVLTSLNDADLAAIGCKYNTKEQVLNLAKLAKSAGASGVVASAQDIEALRRELGKDFVIVTPGIRSSQEKAADDQKRTLGAAEAVKLGADYIVVGRPISQAKDPLAACRQIVGEIEDGLSLS